jgi:hypothetical protein
MTTRPGYVWDATASQWVEIGQAAVVSPFKYQTSQPSSPATGDIWIDSDDEVPSVDSTLYYRWTKTMSGGETSLSGTDNNSLALKYTPGYESVFINGVLQVRGSDYVATTGTTVTGLTALTANDVVMVESIIAYSVGDTYTQTAADAKFYSKTSSASSGEASTVNINTKPWNMPWGLVALATTTTGDSGITTVTDLAGMSVTFTGVANRRYKVSLMLPQLIGTVPSDRARILITDGSNNSIFLAYALSNTYGLPIYLTYVTTASGSTTLKGRLQRDVGSGNLTVYADSFSIKTLMVEDIGPV